MKTMRLSDCCTIVTGNTPKTSNKAYYATSELPFIKPGDINEGAPNELESSEAWLSNCARSVARIAPLGSVLMTCIGIIGKVGITQTECAFNQQINAAIPNDCIDSRYLAHQLAFKGRSLTSVANKAVVPILNKTSFSNIEVRVPELEAQKRSSGMLDDVVAKIRLTQSLQNKLDELVKSRFVEMFGDPVKGEKWPKIKLRDLCSKLGSGATPRGGKSAYKTEGIPLVRSMNVHNGSFVWKDLAYINDEQADRLKNVTLHKGDVLLNITGASVARSCLLPDELAGGRVNQHVAIVRTDPSKIMPIFLNAVFINDSYQRFLLDGSQMAGATREAITKQDMQSMQVPMPPLALQQEFAAFVRQVDKLEFETQQAIDKLQMLYDSLAQDYFGIGGEHGEE